MSNGEATYQEGFKDGTITPLNVQDDITDATIINIGQIVDAGSPPFADSRETGSTYRKDVYGIMKEPVAAKFVIIDMRTKNLVAVSNKFLLTGVHRETREKFQILYGFDEQWMLSVFGEDVPVYTLSGVLLNLKDDKDWVRSFHSFYQEELRASVLVRRNRQAVLYYSNRMLRGYPIGRIETDDSNEETSVRFTLSMLIRKDRFSG